MAKLKKKDRNLSTNKTTTAVLQDVNSFMVHLFNNENIKYLRERLLEYFRYGVDRIIKK